METVYTELTEKKNVRRNLSEIRTGIRTADQPEKVQREVCGFIRENEALFLGFLEDEDAKTRKNAALLLGDVCYEPAVQSLYQAYEAEQTLFVKSAYLDALSHMDVREELPGIKRHLEELLTIEIPEENRKHVNEEIRQLRKILIHYEGISRHTFDVKKKQNKLLLTVEKNQRELVRNQTGGKVHPLGVIVRTDDLCSVSHVRTYRELLFPVPVSSLLEGNPLKAAEQVWNPMLALCRNYHKEHQPFYFRVECRGGQALSERSTFTKKISAEMERLSEGQLINSTSDYEVELRLYADRKGQFFPAIKFYTWKDTRFQYRKHAISASIHPSTAAQIMELSQPYLKENAQIMDPFCGVGTMLIERDIKVSAKEKYGTDIYAQAIEGARENASLAGEMIHFIHRDFFDFRHDYKFDELITNMPVRGRMTREELGGLYEKFFQKARSILAEDAIIILYTGELGFVKKQLRLNREFTLLMEHCMKSKMGVYLLIIRYKGNNR